MSRSKWKPEYISPSFARQKGKSLFFLLNRQTVLTNEMIGKKVYVYNGIKYLLVKITSQKVGHKLGEFVSTRIKAIFKKNKKKKKKK